MNTVLEARGYGLIFLFATLGSMAFAQWSHTQSRAWLNVMAVTCVLGTYTLPFYVVFGGSLLLLSFLVSPSRETFLAGFLTFAAIALLYLPIAADIFEVFTGYAERYATTFVSTFASIDGVFFSLQYFIPHELFEVGPLSFVLLVLAALLYVAFARFATTTDRLSFAAVTVSIAAFLAFCLYCKIVPARVASYLAGPLAFLALLVTGSILTSRSLKSSASAYGRLLHRASGHRASEIRSNTTSHSPLGLENPWRAYRACFPERYAHLDGRRQSGLVAMEFINANQA